MATIAAQPMAGRTEVIILTRPRYDNAGFSINTGPEQIFIGRSMGLMAVRAHHGYKIPLVVGVIEAAVIRVMCVRTRRPVVSTPTDDV
jgi:hypothetical protein